MAWSRETSRLPADPVKPLNQRRLAGLVISTASTRHLSNLFLTKVSLALIFQIRQASTHTRPFPEVTKPISVAEGSRLNSEVSFSEAMAIRSPPDVSGVYS